MQSSLVPERPLIISPTLAATIGLEEAVMLHVFAELLAQRESIFKGGLYWLELDQDTLCKAMPYWAWIDIKRVQKNLQDIGLIVVDPNTGSADRYRYAINQTQQPQESYRAPSVSTSTSASAASVSPVLAKAAAAATGVERFTTTSQGASYIPSNWQPADDCVRQCRQQSIPEDFIHEQIPGFVMYWRERRQSRFSWGNAFYKHVLREWRQEQTRRGSSQLDTTMSAQWRPSADAVGILHNAGVNEAFIEDCVPEFVLYWRERGVIEGAWNSKFIDHIRRQWTKYSASLEHDGLPRPISEGWQPSSACFDILRLAEIDEDYAREKVKEFVMYWRDTRQPHASWNTRFLQYIKFNWAKRLEGLQDVIGNAKNKSITGRSGQGLEESFQRFTDRSWAE